MNQAPGFPQAKGLYDPAFEHDSCGVGFIVHMKGRRSHQLIRDAITILRNLEHRGACGCEANTGDGAGLTLQIPQRFFADVCPPLRIELPHEYAVGMVFLPTDSAQRERCVRVFDEAIADAGQKLLGWRDVPTDADAADLGSVARSREPFIRQVFIAPAPELPDAAAFERKLYVIRRVSENTVWNSDLEQRDFFYVPSLSTRTICYKGQLLAGQIQAYYRDLSHPLFETALALVHQRYSTNTFPTWDLAQPFRYLCHNGEINTLRGNINWMKAREMLFASELFGDDMHKLRPVIREGASDSACFDNAFELLMLTGRSLPHAAMMMIPEAWEHHATMPRFKKDFYEYHLSLMEPWDGPASIAFTDGTVIGALLDRNGLRPSRYWVTSDDYVIMSSEAGVLDVPPEKVVQKGRLEPGKMFLVDMSEGRIVGDEELKTAICRRQPYGKWLAENRVKLDELPRAESRYPPLDGRDLLKQQQAFGYTAEDLRMIITPMARDGKEPVGAMGDDTPLAVLSDHPSRLLYEYFKQLFAQVTNPPLDAIREELVTALRTTNGAEQDLFAETPAHCRHLVLDQPVLTDEQIERIKRMDLPGLKSATLSTLVNPVGGNEKEKEKKKKKENGKEKGNEKEGLQTALEQLCAAASKAIEDGAHVLILSDRGVDAEHMPIPALLATAAVHHHLIREGTRTRVGILVETGEPRETHHFSLLCGYGAGGVNPYVALATLQQLIDEGLLEGIDIAEAQAKFIKATGVGILKIMSKMGISTLQSYRGAQIFEAVGLNHDVIDRYFTWTASRIEGVGLEVLAEESRIRHRMAYPPRDVAANLDLITGGKYQWRRDGERHMFNPDTIALLQQAARQGDQDSYDQYAKLINEQERSRMTLRGLIDFKFDPANEIPLDEVEPAEEIMRRFKTGAMSYGSISQEAHETLAIAMNRIGGKSNSGEGGEDPERYKLLPNGDSRSSAIKQVASGRFGVTSEYLVNSKELQIKMAQGAKPGEGGQLPAEKVTPWIARVRNTTPGVGLISPPPHHDIYSIEDLAQLIYDLKNANIHARVNVKLVAEVGVGTIAAGVSKGHADVVLISGHDGGTGASPISSIKHAGLPWELGIAETQQTLVLNDLRGRIVVETDGQLRTGRDVAIATLLGAEEYGFATVSLVTVGCIMLRKCHLGTCSVGIATQTPELRRKFAGKPEHVLNFMRFVAEDLRRIMARLGFRTINEMVGRCDRLATKPFIDHWKASGLDLSPLLERPDVPPGIKTYCCQPQDHGVDRCFDAITLLDVCKPALERGDPVEATFEIRNTMRTVGTITGSEITRRYGAGALPDDTIRLTFRGSAGQSFAAFTPRGMTFVLEGDANDYFAKGLSGAKVIVYPPAGSRFTPEDNIIIGNVAFYGATSGEAYIRGMAGERFCVRNSGAHTVVEGVGDHGCEYMTGGRVVVLGPTGRNFAAGMSGGFAYVLDEPGDFPIRCNPEMVDLEAVEAPEEIAWLRGIIHRHLELTGSGPARRVLENWDDVLPKFVKVFPKEYRRALKEMAAEAEQPAAVEMAGTAHD